MTWVAEQCEIEVDLGKKGHGGVLHSVASRQAFLSDKSHRIRFVFLPKHTSWLNQSAWPVLFHSSLPSFPSVQGWFARGRTSLESPSTSMSSWKLSKSPKGTFSSFM